MSDDNKATNIKEWHKQTLDMIQQGGPVALVSCFVNGEPTAAIAVVTQNPDSTWTINPRFVAVTSNMVLTDHEGEVAERFRHSHDIPTTLQ